MRFWYTVKIVLLLLIGSVEYGSPKHIEKLHMKQLILLLLAILSFNSLQAQKAAKADLGVLANQLIENFDSRYVEFVNAQQLKQQKALETPYVKELIATEQDETAGIEARKNARRSLMELSERLQDEAETEFYEEFPAVKKIYEQIAQLMNERGFDFTFLTSEMGFNDLLPAKEDSWQLLYDRISNCVTEQRANGVDVTADYLASECERLTYEDLFKFSANITEELKARLID